MKAIIAILLFAVTASAQNPAALKAANQALTNVMQTLRPVMANDRKPLPWTHSETPDNTDPVNLPPGWQVASNAVRQVGAPMRLAVWTFDGPAGGTWAVVAEAHIGTRSNVFRRILWSVEPVIKDLPVDWDQPITLGRP